jgi:hypothetical protein
MRCKARLEGAIFVWEQAMAEIPDAAQRARQMYADGVDTRTIMAETGLTTWSLYNWLDGRASRTGEQVANPLPKRRIVRNLRITPGDRRSLVERMMRSAERQVAEIELRVGLPRHDREKDARMLAVLARAMRELTAVDALNRDLERANESDTKQAPVVDDDPPPDDIDEFRNELARRIRAFVESRSDAGLSGDSTE